MNSKHNSIILQQKVTRKEVVTKDKDVGSMNNLEIRKGRCLTKQIENLQNDDNSWTKRKRKSSMKLDQRKTLQHKATHST